MALSEEDRNNGNCFQRKCCIKVQKHESKGRTFDGKLNKVKHLPCTNQDPYLWLINLKTFILGEIVLTKRGNQKYNTITTNKWAD